MIKLAFVYRHFFILIHIESENENPGILIIYYTLYSIKKSDFCSKKLINNVLRYLMFCYLGFVEVFHSIEDIAFSFVRGCHSKGSRHQHQSQMQLIHGWHCKTYHILIISNNFSKLEKLVFQPRIKHVMWLIINRDCGVGAR